MNRKCTACKVSSAASAVTQFCPKLAISKTSDFQTDTLHLRSALMLTKTCGTPRELPSDWNKKSLWILLSCLTSISITRIPPGAVDFGMLNKVPSILSHWKDSIFGCGEILMRRSAQWGSAFSSGSCYFSLFDVHKCTVSASKLELSDTIMNHVARLMELKVDLAIRLCVVWRSFFSPPRTFIYFTQ